MGKIKFLMDTGGYCFVCLNLAKTKKLTNCNKVNSDAINPLPPGDGVEVEYNDPRTYSFRNLCSYLKINLQEVCSEAIPISSTSTGVRSCSIQEQAEVQGALCSECGPFFERFSKTFGELEGMKMKLEYHLKSIYERMVAADKFHGEFEDLMMFEKEMLRRQETALRNQLVEQLRRKTVARCSTILGRGRGRQAFVQIDKKSGPPAQKETMPATLTPTAEPVAPLHQSTPTVVAQREETIQLQLPPNTEIPHQGGTLQLQLPPDFELPAEGTVHLQLPPDMEIPPGETVQIHLPPNVEVAPGETVQLQFLENVVFNNEETMQTYSVEEPSAVDMNVEEAEVTVPEPTSEIPAVGKFRCGECPSSTVEFKSYRRFEQHYRRFHLETRKPKPTEFKCDVCDIIFPKSYSLTHHKRTVHLGGRYPCKFCAKTFSQADNRRRHMQLKCSARYPALKQLRGRKKKQQREAGRSHENFMALVEEASMAIPVSTEGHNTEEEAGEVAGESDNVPLNSPTITSVDGVVIIKTNKRGRPSTRSLTQTTVPELPPTDDEDLTGQQNGGVAQAVRAPITGKLKCDLCSAPEFESKEALLLHHNRDHVHQEGKFKCEFCYKSFTRKSALKRHSQMHCTMKFRHVNGKGVNVLSPTSDSEVLAAIASITNEPGAILAPAALVPDPVLANSYECYICSKLYPLITPKDHERAHHHGQKILCQGCHQRFLQNSNKLRHKGPKGPRKRGIRIEQNETADDKQRKKSKSKRAVEATQLTAFNPENDVIPSPPEETAVETGSSAILFSLLTNPNDGGNSDGTSDVVKSPRQRSSPSKKLPTVEVVEPHHLATPNGHHEVDLDEELLENGEVESGSRSSKVSQPEGHIKCDSCDKTFNRKSNYTRHQLLSHFGGGGGVDRIKCKFCDKSFHHLRLLSRHMRQHDGEIEGPSVADDDTSSSRGTAVEVNGVSLSANNPPESTRPAVNEDLPMTNGNLSSSPSVAEADTIPESAAVPDIAPPAPPRRKVGRPSNKDKLSSTISITTPTPAPDDNMTNSEETPVSNEASSSISNVKRSSSGRIIIPKRTPFPYLSSDKPDKPSTPRKVAIRKSAPISSNLIPPSPRRLSIANNRRRSALNRRSIAKESPFSIARVTPSEDIVSIEVNDNGVAQANDNLPPTTIKKVTTSKTAPVSPTRRSISGRAAVKKVTSPSRKVSLASSSTTTPTDTSSSSKMNATPEPPTKRSSSGSAATKKVTSSPSEGGHSDSRKVSIASSSTTTSNDTSPTSPSSNMDATPEPSPSRPKIINDIKLALLKTKKAPTLTKEVESPSSRTQKTPSSSSSAVQTGPPAPLPGSTVKYKFCVCKTFVEREKMVRCENEACQFGSWFHYANDPPCVKYNNEEEWYCVMCEPAMTMRKELRKFKGYKLRT